MQASFADKTVRDISAMHPDTYRIFHKYGIDFCCGGKKLLSKACEERHIALDEVVFDLEALQAQTPENENFMEKSQKDLIEHIVSTHHRYLYDDLPRIIQLAEKVAGRHGDRDPHLVELRDLMFKVGPDLIIHMEKEENAIFPLIVELEEKEKLDGIIHKMPLMVIEHEHEEIGRDLDKVVELTDNFQITPKMCGSYQALYHGLKKLNDDVRMHIHKENNILFARMGKTVVID